MTEKPKKLETAEFERAEAAIRWDVAEDAAEETGRAPDQAQADAREAELDAADRKVTKIRTTP
jgi:hypothetical protein